GQQVVKIVHEELVRILGEQSAPLDLGSASPAVIMLAGLQGSGKTTAAGKLAKLLKKKGRTPMLVACDLQRPAAVKQLRVLAEQVGVPVYAPVESGDPVEVARERLLLRAARAHGIATLAELADFFGVRPRQYHATVKAVVDEPARERGRRATIAAGGPRKPASQFRL
ncbi:MAG: winged helix DNA-binding domain-containing protein, partial [Actinobacteria bacterium]|nr:winged helix DNA-binding domain-containing protein [Actinomycetota bacterium]